MLCMFWLVSPFMDTDCCHHKTNKQKWILKFMNPPFFENISNDILVHSQSLTTHVLLFHRANKIKCNHSKIID